MPEFSTEQRRNLAEKKQAMPDGSYPIRNLSDLRNAISAYGRSKNKEATRRWIIRRARELNAENLIPESWVNDSVSHSDRTYELYHYGVKGMKWGIRRKRDKLSESSRSSAKSTSSKKYSVMREKVANGKASVDRFMRSNAGRAVKSAAIIGLSAVGVPYAALALTAVVGNAIAFGQSPLRTLGLDSEYENLYSDIAGQVILDDIKHG